MSVDVVTAVISDALFCIIKCAAPMLIVSLVIGLGVSIFQTVTSISEQTLTFIPKFLGIFLTLILLGHWIINNITTYMNDLWSNFGNYIR